MISQPPDANRGRRRTCTRDPVLQELDGDHKGEIVDDDAEADGEICVTLMLAGGYNDTRYSRQ